MWSDICWLWLHRERPVFGRRWVIVWGKRALHFLSTIRLFLRPQAMRRRGAKIGRLAVLGSSKIDGNLRNLSVGDESSLGRCHISLHEKVSIGRRCVVNDGVQLLSATHYLNDPAWRLKKKPIVVEDYAWICTNAMILPGVRVGRGAVVGAGAVVRVDVPDYCVVVGNPAQQVKSARPEQLDYSPVLLNAPFEAWVGKYVKRFSLDEKFSKNL